MLTLCAVEARKAPLELTTAEVTLKGLMDKARERTPLVGEAREYYNLLKCIFSITWHWQTRFSVGLCYDFAL